MSFTLSEIRGKLNVRLLEATNSGYWTTPEKNGYINDAIMVTAAELQYKQQTSNLTLRFGLTHYLCPSDMLCPLRIRYNPTVNPQNVKLFPSDIPTMEEAMFGWRCVGGGEPSRFIFRSYDYIQIWPAPSQDQDEELLRFDYVPIPEELEDDADEADMPLVAVEAAVDLATFFALHKKDNKSAMTYMERFMQRKSDAQADQDRDNIFKTSKMRPADRFNRAHHSTKFRRVFP